MTAAPRATYRLQLGPGLTLRDAAGLVEYLVELGISDLYLSPILAARPGSTHGYDVVDHARLNPELGGEEGLALLATALRQRGLGLILDVVPNHMCIAGPWNPWWNDVLENGPGSPFARHFDIDWTPPKPDLEAKVLLPVLGDQFGRVLEAQEIQVEHEEGAFFARYWDLRLPLAPRSLRLLLEPVRAELLAAAGPRDARVQEVESIITALGHLPARTETGPAQVRERQREKEVVKRRLAALCAASPEVAASLERTVRAVNGVRGAPRSFDLLEQLLAEQGFRLAFWRVAADEINYRRFFDVNELAAIRVEDPAVFRAVHEVPLRLARDGLVTGLRIDHVDGLLDPAGYLAELRRALEQTGSRCGWVVVEKILGAGERLPGAWPVDGTTGYEELWALGAVLVDREGARRLEALFARLVGARRSFAEVVYESKKLVLEASMSSELTVLARLLDRTSEQDRATRDFTLRTLHAALVEVIASFPVYRTYIRPGATGVSATCRGAIEVAVREATRRNPATSASVFQFIRAVLLLEEPDGLEEEARRERRELVLRFQQLTSPVTAKGVEDTAFYRHFPLAAANEVGGDPARPAVSIAELHAFHLERQAATPRGLTATSTHDTKRSEDVRARLAVLSELPGEWERTVERWRELNAPHRHADGPDPAEEYLVYQTLVGAWPPGGLRAAPDFPARVLRYLEKALREAKLHTSWVSPNEPHERAVAAFAEALLDPARSGPFLDDLARFVALVERPGWWNALTQLVLKVAAPGIPDFYQGCELWDLSLTDPDNRRPVDFVARRAALAQVQREAELDAGGLAERLLRAPDDGRLKLFVTARALALRRARPGPFERGSYVPLPAEGARADHVIAFARTCGDEAVVAVAGRLFTRITPAGALPVGPGTWGATRIVLPPELRGRACTEALTGARLEPAADGGLLLGDVLARLPVALLEVV